MQLGFPTYNFKIKREENANYVFDIVRKKYVLLTPEELVRQHLIHFLHHERGFPLSLMAIEKGILINRRRKRFDVLIINPQAKPLMIIECKSPDVKLTDETLMQIAVYNSHFQCPFLLVTNGIYHAWTTFSDGKVKPMTEGIPYYKELTC